MGIKAKVLIISVTFLALFTLWTAKYLIPSISESKGVHRYFKNIINANDIITTSDYLDSRNDTKQEFITSLPIQEIKTHEIVTTSVPETVQPNNSVTTSSLNKEEDTMNSYERSLVEKEKKREAFLKKYVEEQRELALYPGSAPRFVIVYPLTSGIGNNLAILSEGILMSMLTRRRLLIYDWPSFNQYFSLPMENYTLIVSNFTSMGALNSGLQCRVPPKKFISAPNRNIILRTFCKFTEYILKSPDYYDFLNNNGFVINPKLNSYQDIRKMVNYFFYVKVIQLLPEIREMVEEEKARLEWNSYYWVGIQIRSGKMPGDEGHNVFMFKDDLKMFTKYALDRTEKAAKKQAKPVKWFIAADSLKVKEDLLQTYPKYYVSTECTMSHSFRDVKRSDRTEGMLCTLLDNYLLSEVNEAVVTGTSTYGLLATYRNLNIKKDMVLRGDWKKFNKGA